MQGISPFLGLPAHSLPAEDTVVLFPIIFSPWASRFGFLQWKILGCWVTMRGEGEVTATPCRAHVCVCLGSAGCMSVV